MADDFRTRTRQFLGIDPPAGDLTPRRRSSYARFTTPGLDTSRNQLIGGALLYVVLTVFCIALVLGPTGVLGRVVFALLAVLGFVFAMQRIVMLVNRRDEASSPRVEDDDEPLPRTRPAASKRTGGSGHTTTASKKAGGARRSGDPRRSP